MADQSAPIFGITRKSLEATIIHACPHCGGPGVLHGRPVGKICPLCGGQRSRDRALGELCASMPLWIWKTVLAAKWLVVKTINRRSRHG